MLTSNLDQRNQDLKAAGVSEHGGFPNPATDRSLAGLDINKLLIKHRTATYLMCIQGGGWESLGIFNNDVVVIDRAETINPNDIVVWWAGDAFTISHANKTPKDIAVWGVVTATIHRHKTNNPKP